MAKLYFRYGAMNSGKSTLLLQTAHNYEENGMSVVIIKPLIEVFNNRGLLYSLLWLVLGGIFYTIGGIIYGLKIPKTRMAIITKHPELLLK